MTMADITITRQEWEVTITRADGDQWGDIDGLDPVRITVLFTADGGGAVHPVRITVASRHWFDDHPAAGLLAKAEPWLVSAVAAARDCIAGKGVVTGG
jgi:hypothetical protein